MGPTVKFSCLIPGVKESFPIKPISHFRPQWLDSETQDYVAERKKYQENPWEIIQNGMSIAKCTGIRKLFTTGWVITTWQDIIIDNNIETGELSWRTPIDQTTKSDILGPAIVFHNQKTFKHCPHLAKTPHILKIESPWIARLPEGYSMIQMPFPYQEHEFFQAAVGIFPEDMGYMQMNSQLIWKAPGVTLVPAGTPLAHFMLIKNEDYKYEIADVTPKEEKAFKSQLTIMNSTWERNYTEIKKAIRNTMDTLDE